MLECTTAYKTEYRIKDTLVFVFCTLLLVQESYRVCGFACFPRAMKFPATTTFKQYRRSYGLPISRMLRQSLRRQPSDPKSRTGSVRAGPSSHCNELPCNDNLLDYDRVGFAYLRSANDSPCDDNLQTSKVVQGLWAARSPEWQASKFPATDNL